MGIALLANGFILFGYIREPRAVNGRLTPALLAQFIHKQEMTMAYAQNGACRSRDLYGQRMVSQVAVVCRLFGEKRGGGKLLVANGCFGF